MLVSAYSAYQNKYIQPSLPRQNTHAPAFGTRELTENQLYFLKIELIEREKLLDKSQEKPCGTLKIETKTGGYEDLNVLSYEENGKNHICVRDKTKKLLGYGQYFIIEDSKKTEQLYNANNDEKAYMSAAYMLSGHQDRYKHLGNKIHQLFIEKSIQEGCPGRIFLDSTMQTDGLCPTAFHYDNGYAPYNPFIVLPSFKYEYQRDFSKEKQILEDMKDNKGYTDINHVKMYLPPEHFAKWKQQIRENPILDETKQLIAQGRF